ncbi:MAG: stage II sporulation protein M [Acidobacteriota bacterium]
MEYASFLALRGQSWTDFETRLQSARQRPRGVSYGDLEGLAVGYRQILHDHALASARYPGTGAARRLGRLAVEATRFLYREHRESGSTWVRFWTRSFPEAFRQNLGHTLAAIFLFSVAALFGFSLAVTQVSLGASLLGPKAVRDLENGQLWTESLVHSVPPSLSSSAIARNNVGVALAGWAAGALAGIGALYILFLNGFLLGALFGVTLHYSLAGGLLEFVSAHGPLEITLILVTSAAGLRMGRALVEATDRRRRDVLRIAGRDSLRILLGCLPWFIPLGLVEGYLSPSPLVAPALKGAVGISLLALFWMTAWNPFLSKEQP